MINHRFTTAFICFLLWCSISVAQQPDISISGTESHFFHSGSQGNSLAPDIFALNYIIPDFQVNEVTVPLVSRVSGPAIASDSDGNYVVTWEAENNGDYNIFAQYYTHDGRAINGNFIVNDDYGTQYQGCPDIAMDYSGNFVVVWHDKRNGGLSHVYGQRYTREGKALGKNFKVNTTLEYGTHQYPAVAIDGAGNIVITWEIQERGDYDIWAQRFTIDGIRIGDNFKVSDQTEISAQHYPDICADASGRFVITWQDTRNQRYEIYAQRFSNQGFALGDNFRVSGKHAILDKPIPAIAANWNGDFAIVYEDKFNGPEFHEIFGQKFKFDGEMNGGFQASTDPGGIHELPDIAFDHSGRFVVTWVHVMDGQKFVRARRYDGLGDWRFKINTNNANAKYATVTCIGNEKFVLACQGSSEGERNIFMQPYFMNGNCAGNEVRVNVNPENQTQNHPKLALDNQGNMLISWQEYRSGILNPHIHSQFYSADGVPKGNHFRVDMYQGPAELPSTAISRSGIGAVVWQDSRNDNADIFLQAISPDGTPDYNTNIQVNDDLGTTNQIKPSVSADNSNFIVTWQDSRNGNYDIYAQLYSTGFTPTMPNFKVNDDLGVANQTVPATAMNSEGAFCITWQDSRNGLDDDIYLQSYNKLGIVQGQNIRVNDDLINVEQVEPVVAIDNFGNFIVAWRDCRNSSQGPDIYAQCYFPDGRPRNTNFRVNDDLEYSYQYTPSIAVDSSGNFLVAWVDYRNGNFDIYAQCYDIEGNSIGNNFRITGTGQKKQLNPDVKLQDNKIYSVWTDNRAGDTGFDIWVNVLDWDNPSTGVQTNNVSPMICNFRLHQNFPNPFNPTTTIQYVLPKASFVELQILNIKGQVVQYLLSEQQAPGTHEILWNATNSLETSLPSGIYFSRLKVGEHILTKRMLLMK